MPNRLNLTWRDVLDSYGEFQPMWGSIQNFLLVVANTKYKYFNWNGNVYELVIDGRYLDWKDTGIDVEELS